METLSNLDAGAPTACLAQTLPELVWLRAATSPSLPAFTELLDGELQTLTLSWAELDQRAAAIASLLVRLEAPGLPVLLVYPPGTGFLTAFLGCLYAGAIPVPTYPPEPRRLLRSVERFRAIAADCDARLVLSTPELQALVEPMQALAPELKRLAWYTSPLVTASSASNGLGPPSEDARFVRQPQSPETLALLQYTSGSTGTPKGVMVTHRGILLNCKLFTDAFALQPGEVSVTWLPNYHDMGLIEGLLRPLYSGSHGVMMTPLHFLKRPMRWLEAISRYRAAISGGPNFAYELCCEHATPADLERLDLSCWRAAYNGAEPIRASTLERFSRTFDSAGFRSSTHWPGYGLAEATLLVSGSRLQQGAVTMRVDRAALEAHRVVSLEPHATEYGSSHPAPDAPSAPDRTSQILVSVGNVLVEEARIVDPETRLPLPPERVGELWLRGPSLAVGYWQRPEATRETFQAQLEGSSGPSDWLRTGDLAFLRPDGELFITGRRKDLIIIRGRNHYPQDLEQRVEQSHPALFRPGCSAAFSVDIQGEERVVLVLELQRRHADQDPRWLERRQSPPEVEAFAPTLTQAPNIPEVLEQVRACLLEQFELQPYAVLLIKPGSIHKTSSGKIQRQACKRAFQAGELEVIHAWRDPAVGTEESAAPQAGLAAPALEGAAIVPNVSGASAGVLSAVPSSLPEPTHQAASRAPRTPKPIEEESLRALMQARIAQLLHRPEASIDLNRSFVELGLDSRGSLTLLGQLEVAVGQELSSSLLYDHPTPLRLIRQLVQLGQETGDAQRSDRPMPPAPEPAGPHTSGHPPLSAEEPIAIIGMACRFPGAEDLRGYWRLLEEGRSATQDVPPDRGFPTDALLPPDGSGIPKKVPLRGCFLSGLDRFDATAFGLSPHEAERMDPQQRLMLEVTWEALADAALTPQALAGTQAGVFVGIANSDFGRALFREVQHIDGWTGTGAALSIAANRISYLLDCHGPSLAIDTACSSSLVAIAEAMSALRQGTCPLALAGGVSLILSPEVSYTFARAGVMAPDGCCKTFDARADGYARGEGAGVVVLKRLDAALRDRDPIRAVLRGVAVGSNGRSNGLMAPNGESQAQLINQAWQRSGLVPGDAQLIETHGTGTALGDPVEVGALGRVVGQPSHPIWLGAVKTQIGHLEAAAGVAGLIKTVLAVQAGAIPGNLHFISPNPQIPFERLPFRLPQGITPWPAVRGPRRAGVSSFGFGGTNAHVVVEQAPQASADEEATSSQPWLLPLSAHSETGLRALARALSARLSDRPSLPALVRTALARDHGPWRAVLQASSLEQLQAGLTQLQEGGATATASVIAGQVFASSRLEAAPLAAASPASPAPVFVFPGQGAQSPTMARALFQTEPAFRQRLLELDAHIQALAGWSLVAMMTAPTPDERLTQARYSQPALFAVQVALAAAWESWNVFPAAVVGHSMGEVAAAVVSGALSLDSALRIILARGRLMQRVSGQGAMVAVELPVGEVEALLASGYLSSWSAQVGVAAVNSVSSCTLSGATMAVMAVQQCLQDHGVYCRRIQVDVAGHSPLLDPLLFELEDAIGPLEVHPVRVPTVSSVTGSGITAETFGSGYWCRNLREPVRFDRALKTLVDAGHALFLELSPHPSLLGAIEQALQQNSSVTPGRAIASCRREDELGAFRMARAALFVTGYPVTLSAPLQPGPRAALPPVPWERQHCWQVFSVLSDAGTSLSHDHPLLGSRTESPLFEGAWVWDQRVSVHTLSFLADHQVQDAIVFPATGYIELARAAGAQRLGQGPIVISQLELHRALVLSERPSRLQTVLRIHPGAVGERLEVYSRGDGLGASAWTLHATAVLGTHEGLTPQAPPGSPTLRGSHKTLARPLLDLRAVFARCTERVSAERHYRSFLRRGIQYGPAFQGMREGVRREGEACCLIELPPQAQDRFSTRLELHPALLDACLQAMGMALPGFLDHGDQPYLPILVERVTVHAMPGTRVWAWARVAGPAAGEARTLTADIFLADETGRVRVEVTGLTVGALAPQQGILTHPAHWHYQVEWEDLPSHSSSPLPSRPSATWLLVTAQEGDATIALESWLASSLVQRGEKCLVARAFNPAEEDRPSAAGTPKGGWSVVQEVPGRLRARLSSVASLQGLLQHAQALAAQGPLQVVYLGGTSAGNTGAAVGMNARAGQADSLALPELTAAVEQQVGGLLLLSQALATLEHSGPVSLHVVTRGLWQADSSQTPCSGEVESMLWGLGRSLAHELTPAGGSSSSRWGGLYDIEGPEEAGGALESSLQTLLALLLNPGDEDQLRVRAGRASGARLVARPLSALGAPPTLDGLGSYCISGGTGGLGLALTRWLADRGARRILLLSRSGLTLEGKALQHTLANAGITVLDVRADLSDLEQTREALEAVWTPDAPIRGIIHAAGIVLPQPLAATSMEALLSEARPKVLGGWVLDHLSRAWPLDFFVTFGSAAAVWGSSLLASYSAANAYLDALVSRRRRAGLPGLNVAWAMWGEAGMASRGPLQARLTQAGLQPMPIPQALWVLERLLGADAREPLLTGPSVVAALDPVLFKEVYESHRRRKLLAAWRSARGPGQRASRAVEQGTGEQGTGEQGTGEQGTAEPGRQSLPKEPRARERVVQEVVAREAARALGLSLGQLRLELPLSRQGLDSLSAVTLRNGLEKALGVRLSVLQLLSEEGVRGLVTALSEALEPEKSAAPTQRPAPLGLEDDFLLEPEVLPESVPRAIAPPRVVLLTGATGFLGAEVLAALLNQPAVKVVCLVRASNDQEGFRRVIRTLEARGLEPEGLAQRLEPTQLRVVSGDLGLPQLGLDEPAWEALAAQVETIVHVGYLVNFLYGYEDLRATNVQGLRTLLRLATAKVCKPLHFVSSFSVFLTPEYSGKTVAETDPAFPGEGGYRESKRQAEALVMQAAARGLPVSVVRPPFVSWHSRTGVYNPRDFLMQLITGCLEVGAYPALALRFHLEPVDRVGQALVRLVLNPTGAQAGEQPPRLHCLTDEAGVSWLSLVHRLNDAGAELVGLALEPWLARIRAYGAGGALHSFFSEESRGQGLHLLEAFSERAAPSRVDATQGKILLGLSDPSDALNEQGLRALLLRLQAGIASRRAAGLRGQALGR